jgi:flagellar motor switch protein FliN
MNGKTSSPAAATPSGVEDFKLVHDIAVKVSVEIDQMKVSVQKLSDLTSDCILTSTKPAGNPIEICVNGCHVARGEIIALGSAVGVRITEIIGKDARKPGVRA